jgi:hypothetical protein
MGPGTTAAENLYDGLLKNGSTGFEQNYWMPALKKKRKYGQSPGTDQTPCTGDRIQ